MGTIVDATIINAPPSTKNASKARDPDMHQTKKGNQWHEVEEDAGDVLRHQTKSSPPSGAGTKC